MATLDRPFGTAFGLVGAVRDVFAPLYRPLFFAILWTGYSVGIIGYSVGLTIVYAVCSLAAAVIVLSPGCIREEDEKNPDILKRYEFRFVVVPSFSIVMQWALLHDCSSANINGLYGLMIINFEITFVMACIVLYEHLKRQEKEQKDDTIISSYGIVSAVFTPASLVVQYFLLRECSPAYISGTFGLMIINFIGTFLMAYRA
ncbi:hypothetical protein RQP46_010835 [Phenoliferia psychrophenolica]